MFPHWKGVWEVTLVTRYPVHTREGQNGFRSACLIMFVTAVASIFCRLAKRGPGPRMRQYCCASKGMMNSRPNLDRQSFDVLIIGGGINGVAIARECARTARRTLLVEQKDFGSGTTSRSTRLIHGGLRYLEQGELTQVRESLRERQRLLREYPHLVHPLQFLLALDGNSRRNALAVRAGLWFYRCLGGTRAPDVGQQRNRLERLLDSGHRFSIFNYEDAQCEFPELLVAQWLTEAVAAGCQARNYTRVLEVTTAGGKVTGALLRDQINDAEEKVEAKWVINAAGPWVDEVCQHSRIQTSNRMIGGVRGSHIVISKFDGAPDDAVYAEGVDGRPIFVIPWNGQILVGSTEVADDGDPGRVQASEGEIQYLLRSLGNLFTGIRISDRCIHYAFAGIRPLPWSSHADASSTTRRHFVHDHAPDGAAGMISLVGGKLTTAALAARDCAKKIGIKPAKFPGTAVTSEAAVSDAAERAIAVIADIAAVDRRSSKALLEWQGSRSLDIARRARHDGRLRECLCPHTEHIVAEAVDAFENKFAVTLGDVLLRRVPIALGACWSPECAHTAAFRIASALGWSDRRTAAEIEQFDAECEAFLQRPPLAQMHH
jgi:glycerol-3-phosphate dehydrogenase